VEAKVFEVLVKGGDSGVRIYERSKKKKCSIFIRKDEIVWLVGALEEVAETGQSEVFWDQSRAGFPRLITQKRSNNHGRFLMIEEFDGRRRCGSILVPEGRYGQGWARLMVELDGANSSIWEGRKPTTCLSEPVAVIPGGVEAQKAPVHQKNRPPALVCGSSARDSLKLLSQAGGAPGSGVPGVALCGRNGTAGLLGDASSKAPAPLSVYEACLPRQGRETTREELVCKGVSSFNAKMELLICRDWLRKIRGEVDAGLQRLDLVFKELDFSGPGPVKKPESINKPSPKPPSVGLDSVSAPKPFKKQKPKYKKPHLPKAASVGPGLGPKAGSYLGQARTYLAVATSGMDHPKGSSDHSNGPRGVGCSKGCVAVHGPTEAAPRVSLGVDLCKEAGVPGLGVGRMGMGDAISVGFPAPASSSRLGEPGPVSRPETSGLVVVECSVSSRKRGVSGSAPLSPAPEYLDPKSPVCLSIGKRAVSTEPSKLQVYQRSRWRISTPLQSAGPSRLSGQLKSRGLLGSISSVSPVRLAFDGCDEVHCESALGSAPTSDEAVGLGPAPTQTLVTLCSASNSVEVVPESLSGEVSTGSSMAGVDSVVSEKLDRALVVGEAAGLTCEGQTGLLNEFLGQIVVGNLGRSSGGERGSHVINES
jgi:hypothetical protein